MNPSPLSPPAGEHFCQEQLLQYCSDRFETETTAASSPSCAEIANPTSVTNHAAVVKSSKGSARACLPITPLETLAIVAHGSCGVLYVLEEGLAANESERAGRGGVFISSKEAQVLNLLDDAQLPERCVLRRHLAFKHVETASMTRMTFRIEFLANHVIIQCKITFWQNGQQLPHDRFTSSQQA